MTLADIRARLFRTDPLLVDTVIAVVLTLAVWVLVYVVTNRPPGVRPIPNLRSELFIELRRPALVSAYALIAATFLPLAFRRKAPWIALTASGTAALVYSTAHMPPAPVVFAPMFALYSLAAYAKRAGTGLIALLVAGVVIAVPIFAFSSSVRWVSELVGAVVMLAAAALLGQAERNRREYVAEVERRALEAERTRDEEALRRADEERIRIAREVHDIVAHSLSIVTVQASAAATLLDSDPERARESIEHVRTTGKEALAELRSMLDVLRTGEIDPPRAPAADISRVDALAGPVRDAGIAVDIEKTGDLQTVPAYASVSAYRVVQEALTNCVRHAKASHIRVVLTASPDSLTVLVTDNGSSPAPRDADQAVGHGMRGMRERVEALGGSFQAGPVQGGGFRVLASIPLARGRQP